jgi:signal transduction histidine kinase
VRPDSPGLARVRPDELVDETLALVRAEAEDKGIAVARQSPPMAAVWIEADRLRQVLINLLVNAIHATQRGGRIVVGIEAGDGRLRFSVADSGKGIPGENLERIFEPFFSDQPPGEGTGLGLFVTRQIVDRMGGTITVRSQVGRGTTMTVAVPHRCGDPGAARGPETPVCGQEARP